MFETSPTRSLLRLDPDLGRLLADERRDAAERQLIVNVVDVAPGECTPHQFLGEPSPASIGTLVVGGTIVREIRVHDAPSAELFGPGDIIRRSHSATDMQVAPASVRWDAVDRTSVALMNGRTALMLRHYPEVMAVVLDRINSRAERLAITQAISQLTGVENRVEMLLWHLSERWGRVGKGGVTVTLRLSHRLLGALVGARRPTVSTAVARLAEEGRVVRANDGTWVLAGFGPPSVAPSEPPMQPSRGWLGSAVAA
jgi:CRP-like cAMP-binding protein